MSKFCKNIRALFARLLCLSLPLGRCFHPARTFSFWYPEAIDRLSSGYRRAIFSPSSSSRRTTTSRSATPPAHLSVVSVAPPIRSSATAPGRSINPRLGEGGPYKKSVRRVSAGPSGWSLCSVDAREVSARARVWLEEGVDGPARRPRPYIGLLKQHVVRHTSVWNCETDSHGSEIACVAV